MDENKIIIVDDNNVEHEMTILFTYEDEDSGKNFVTYFDQNSDEGNIYASLFDDNNTLYPITEDSDWKIIEEVLERYMEENEGITDHECGCGHDHGDEDEDEEDHECGCGHNHDEEDHECNCEEKCADCDCEDEVEVETNNE